MTNGWTFYSYQMIAHLSGEYSHVISEASNDRQKDYMSNILFFQQCIKDGQTTHNLTREILSSPYHFSDRRHFERKHQKITLPGGN